MIRISKNFKKNLSKVHLESKISLHTDKSINEIEFAMKSKSRLFNRDIFKSSSEITSG